MSKEVVEWKMTYPKVRIYKYDKKAVTIEEIIECGEYLGCTPNVTLEAGVPYYMISDLEK